MTSVNHALTGTAIGLLVGQPWLAIPLSVGSHYVCDALPHYGPGQPYRVVLKTLAFRNYVIINAAVCFLLVAALAAFQPQHWLLASICAFAAAAPDFASVNRYLKIRSGKKYRPGRYSKFAIDIQWFERPVGAVVEAAWFIAALVIIVPFLR